MGKNNKAILHEIFEESLGVELFNQVAKFFVYLFADPEGEPEKPLDNRRFIILTRKGFSLWQAATMCGLTGDEFIGPDRVISDRNWKKMTVPERQDFTRDRDVFIVDDNIITGFNVKSIYMDLDPAVCKSRNVVCLSSSYTFSQRNIFEYYKDFGSITALEKREQNAQIMVMLYNMAIPFTAESPIYSIHRVRRTVLEEWKKLSLNGWRAETEKTDLDFGGAGVVQTSFLLHAPSFNAEAENMLFRGMRVCYRELSEEEDDPNQEYAEVSLIPCASFDIIDFQEAIEYLKKYAPEDSWLRRQIISGETNRKRIVVHRVMSYLLGSCVLREFKRDVLGYYNIDPDKKLKPFELNGHILEKYHFGEQLLKEIEDLIPLGCDITGGEACPYHNLLLPKKEYDAVVNELFGTHWEGVEVPKKPTNIEELDKLLCACASSERFVDPKTYLLDKPNAHKTFPILFYEGKNRGVVTLDYVRRSIASFHSTMFSLGGKLYLARALVPGEGSSFALIKNYDFIWGLHHLILIGAYKKGTERKFKNFWNKKVPSSKVDDTVLKIIIKFTPSFWPTRKEIWQSYADNTVIDAAIEVAEEFSSVQG